jgi:hypothetical protein
MRSTITGRHLLREDKIVCRTLDERNGSTLLFLGGAPIALMNGMTDSERETAEALLNRIETAVGELPDRSGPNGVLIKSIIESVNGLRSLLSVVRAH